MSDPFAPTLRRTTESPNDCGGELPGAATEGDPPLPVVSRSVPEPSDMSPTPACQMPAPSPFGLSTHLAVILAVVVDTPKIQPSQGWASQWLPNPA